VLNTVTVHRLPAHQLLQLCLQPLEPSHVRLEEGARTLLRGSAHQRLPHVRQLRQQCLRPASGGRMVARTRFLARAFLRRSLKPGTLRRLRRLRALRCALRLERGAQGSLVLSSEAPK